LGEAGELAPHGVGADLLAGDGVPGALLIIELDLVLGLELIKVLTKLLRDDHVGGVLTVGVVLVERTLAPCCSVTERQLAARLLDKGTEQNHEISRSSVRATHAAMPGPCRRV